MTEDKTAAAKRALAAALDDKDPPITFRLVRQGGKRGKSKWVIAPEGITVHVPGWAVAAGLTATIAAAVAALAHFEGWQLKKKGAAGAYGPDRVNLADIDYARNELGPIITPMEWMVGIPMYARAHRDYRLELAAEVAAPSPAGISDAKNANPDWHIVLFTLSTGEAYVRCYGPAMTPPQGIQDYWRETDGSQQSVETMAGTRGAVLKAAAVAEGHWPPRKLTVDEKAYGNTGPP